MNNNSSVSPAPSKVLGKVSRVPRTPNKDNIKTRVMVTQEWSLGAGLGPELLQWGQRWPWGFRDSAYTERVWNVKAGLRSSS